MEPSASRDTTTCIPEDGEWVEGHTEPTQLSSEQAESQAAVRGTDEPADEPQANQAIANPSRPGELCEVEPEEEKEWSFGTTRPVALPPVHSGGPRISSPNLRTLPPLEPSDHPDVEARANEIPTSARSRASSDGDCAFTFGTTRPVQMPDWTQFKGTPRMEFKGTPRLTVAPENPEEPERQNFSPPAQNQLMQPVDERNAIDGQLALPCQTDVEGSTVEGPPAFSDYKLPPHQAVPSPHALHDVALHDAAMQAAHAQPQYEIECPSGHVMSPATAPCAGYSCAACGMALFPGATVWTCPPCNCHVCQKCSGAQGGEAFDNEFDHPLALASNPPPPAQYFAQPPQPAPPVLNMAYADPYGSYVAGTPKTIRSDGKGGMFLPRSCSLWHKVAAASCMTLALVGAAAGLVLVA